MDNQMVGCDFQLYIYIYIHEAMVWAVTLQRPLQDWELGEYTNLMAFLYQLKIKRTVVDQMRWSCSTSGLFEVRSFYRLLTFHNATNFP
jgi:hypothetical protein